MDGVAAGASRASQIGLGNDTKEPCRVKSETHFRRRKSELRYLITGLVAGGLERPRGVSGGTPPPGGSFGAPKILNFQVAPPLAAILADAAHAVPTGRRG
ncbi:MAG: hypothetical protein ACE5GT_13285, partial [Rhodospirillales bacterium]